MSDFRLKLNRLKNIPYASSVQGSLPFEKAFDLEFFFEGSWKLITVKPILVNAVVIFLVHFPGKEDEPMALVYNKRDTWSDIERESTGLTDVIGLAIENYYSDFYLPWTGVHRDGSSHVYWDNHLLN